MDRNSPRRRTQARLVADLGLLSNPNRVHRQRHTSIPLSRAIPNRRVEEVFTGQWNDMPAINRILEAAEQKDIHNNVDVQKDTLSFLIEAVMRSGGMIPGHRHYRAILRSTVQSLTRNHMMRAFLQGKTQSQWGGKQTLKAVCKASFEADGEEPGRIHHASVEFIIAGILVYKVLPFVRSEDEDLKEWMGKEAGLLTTALFSYDPICKPKLYTCEHAITTESDSQRRPTTSAIAKASALDVALAAECRFA